MNAILFFTGFGGGFYLLFATWARYLFYRHRQNLGRGKSLLYAFRIIDWRGKKPEVVAMLMQYTGLIWMLSGIGYSLIGRSFEIRGIVDDVLVFIVIFGPQIGLVCVLSILKKKYWGEK